MRGISDAVVQKTLQLYERHVVSLLLCTVGIGRSMKLKVRQTIDEVNTLKVIRKGLSRPPEKVIEVLGVVGVTH
jgi:hypothetical protein